MLKLEPLLEICERRKRNHAAQCLRISSRALFHHQWQVRYGFFVQGDVGGVYCTQTDCSRSPSFHLGTVTFALHESVCAFDSWGGDPSQVQACVDAAKLSCRYHPTTGMSFPTADAMAITDLLLTSIVHEGRKAADSAKSQLTVLNESKGGRLISRRIQCNQVQRVT